ncbi:MAG: prolyl oligopeptidase family serine peptidase [Alphaproteobacteria bacterium]|nr:prolyl oligopeptidase family serine peptidase [Alphaproteobacteria bacterium]
MKSVLAALGTALILCQGSAAADEAQAWYCDAQAIRWTKTELGDQKAVVALPKEGETIERLVVFLHGDAARRDPTYQYKSADFIAKNWPGTVAVGMLRPSYKDGCGKGSDGADSFKMGDNYTPQVVASLAASIRALKDEFNPKQTIIMGHSGGSALTGLLAARYGALQDMSVMISCPCDLPKWRQMMAKLTENPRWKNDMPGLSATAEVGTIPVGADVRLFVGANDRVTPPFLSEEFVAAAKARGMEFPLTIVPDASHDFIVEQRQLKAVLDAIRD